MQFTYKITKYDAANQTIVVVFGDGHWAEIRLANPLPPNVDALEKIISTYTAPKEVIEAQQSPSADLSYINSLIDVERSAARFSITPPHVFERQNTNDPNMPNLVDPTIPTTVV